MSDETAISPTSTTTPTLARRTELPTTIERSWARRHRVANTVAWGGGGAVVMGGLCAAMVPLASELSGGSQPIAAAEVVAMGAFGALLGGGIAALIGKPTPSAVDEITNGFSINDSGAAAILGTDIATLNRWCRDDIAPGEEPRLAQTRAVAQLYAAAFRPDYRFRHVMAPNPALGGASPAEALAAGRASEVHAAVDLG